MVRVFLDVNVGDEAAFLQAKAAHERAVQYLAEVGPSMGLASSFADMDAESREMVAEMYRADPKWSSKGDIATVAPNDLCVGRLVIELHDDVPKAVDNFKCLATGEKGKGKESGKPLHFLGTPLHRIVKGFMCQGGDVVRHDGSGGESIYGKKFNDEKPGLKRKHDAAGIVGMANKGKNTNTSQFYITFAAQPQLDGKHVVIGKVVEGLDVLAVVEARAAADKDGEAPKEHVKIGACGVL